MVLHRALLGKHVNPSAQGKVLQILWNHNNIVMLLHMLCYIAILRTSGFADWHGPLVQLSGSNSAQNCATHVLQTVKVPKPLSQHTSSSGIHLH